MVTTAQRIETAEDTADRIARTACRVTSAWYACGRGEPWPTDRTDGAPKGRPPRVETSETATCGTTGAVAKVTCACGESVDLTNYEEW